MQATEEPHDHAAHHDIVKVGDHEVGIVEMDVYAQGGEEQARQPADSEKADKAHHVEHRRV